MAMASPWRMREEPCLSRWPLAQWRVRSLRLSMAGQEGDSIPMPLAGIWWLACWCLSGTGFHRLRLQDSQLLRGERRDARGV